MDDKKRLEKNNTIREHGKATRLHRSSQRPVAVELKLDIKCLNKAEQEKIRMYFVQCKWLLNYLLSLSAEEFRDFDYKTSTINGLDRDRNIVERELAIPAKLRQSVYSDLKDNMKALASKREKTGKRNGKLRFRSSYDSISLNQYRNTHWIVAGDKGDKSGHYRNTVHIAGIKRPIRAFGMAQIPKGCEFANAKLVQRPSGIYLMLTCYVDRKPSSGKEEKARDAIGIDFGIKTSITTSDGEKHDISVEESGRLKGLQRKLARQQKGSNGRYQTVLQIRKEYERLGNRRKDKANKIYHDLTKGGRTVVMQDENIKGWHKGLFGKQVQSSALGTIKSKLQRYDNIIVVDRFFPSTRLCPICGKVNDDITLPDRIFSCGCGYSEDRDIKAAKTLLMEGLAQKAFPCVGRTRTPEERMSDPVSPNGDMGHSALRLEATPSSVS